MAERIDCWLTLLQLFGLFLVCLLDRELARFGLFLVCLLDRELARFIYVREVKRFDPFKFSIYVWCINIAIAGRLAPVRLAWVPFLRVPKNGFIYVEADNKKTLCTIVT